MCDGATAAEAEPPGHTMHREPCFARSSAAAARARRGARRACARVSGSKAAVPAESKAARFAAAGFSSDGAARCENDSGSEPAESTSKQGCPPAVTASQPSAREGRTWRRVRVRRRDGGAGSQRKQGVNRTARAQCGSGARAAAAAAARPRSRTERKAAWRRHALRLSGSVAWEHGVGARSRTEAKARRRAPESGKASSRPCCNDSDRAGRKYEAAAARVQRRV